MSANLAKCASTICGSRAATADPEIVRGYQTLSEAGLKTGKLDAKTRELIALGVAVTRQCDSQG